MRGFVQMSLKERLAYAARILAMTGQDAGLAGQLTARSDRDDTYWTLRFGLGFEEATAADPLANLLPKERQGMSSSFPVVARLSSSASALSASARG